jgi:hypothetical protein
MLTVSTPIPTALRGKIRALVKAHPHWRLFLEAKEIISADAKNRDLIEFALFHPSLVRQIEQLIMPNPEMGWISEAEALLQQLARPPKLRVRVKARTATV